MRFFNDDGIVGRESYAAYDRHLPNAVVVHKQSRKRSRRVIPARPDEDGFGSIAASLIDRQMLRSAHEIPYSGIVPADVRVLVVRVVRVGHFSSPQN